MNRHGNAIILTMIALMAITSMMLVSTAQMRSSFSLNKVQLAQQQAAQAAEAVASFREARLVDIAASNDLARLTINPDTGWGNYRGVPYGEDDPWIGVQWFGNCLVRWRVEPARVGNDLGRWTSNPTVSGFGTPSDGNWMENHDLYHYRIVTQAYFLADNQALDSASIADLEDAGLLPWQDSGKGSSVASVQTQRVVQMRLNSLFKYALFYASEGRAGDIEIHNGPAQGVRGKVHSNGAVFMGGSEKVKQSGANPEVFTGSYGEGFTGEFNIGTADEKASLTGIDGVFMMRKVQLYQGHRDNRMAGIAYVPKSDPDYGDAVWFGDGSTDPLPNNSTFPIPVTTSWGGGKDMNYFGDNKKVNGVTVQPWADTRTPDQMMARHGAYVRDGVSSGAQVVKTLANIPQLGGRPFEHQRQFPPGTQLWTTDPGDPSNIAAWTVLPNEPPAPYYDFGGATPPYSWTDIVGFKSSGTTGELVTNFAQRLYLSRDPIGLRNYINGNSYSGGSPDLLAAVDVPHNDQVANPGLLRNSLAPIQAEWFVDAGGLYQYYQCESDGSVDTQNRGIYRVDGDNNSEAALSIIDIFDPAGNYTYHPGTSGAVVRRPGQTNFRYHGPAAGDRPNPWGVRDGFSDNAVPGLYLTFAREGGQQPETAGKYGLIIRERPYQIVPDASAATAWTNMPNRPPWPMPGGYAGGATTWVRDHLNYLRSQYMVFFGPYEVTDLFLAYQAGEAATSGQDTDLIVYERDILDDRKLATMQYTFWGQDSSIAADAYRDHRVNVLTLNLRKVLDFIENTDGSAVNTALIGRKLAGYFHGMIYGHRTRRSDGYTPWDSMRWQRRANLLWYQSGSINWAPPPGANKTNWIRDPAGAEPNYDVVNAADRDPGFDWRVGSGPSFVFHSGFRLANAEDIDYGEDYDDGIYRCKKGLTFISPNPVYLWGHINVTKYADSKASRPYGTRATFVAASADDGHLLEQRLDWDVSGTIFSHGDEAWDSFKLPPMAVFTDNLTMLSTVWDDAVQAAGSETKAEDTCMFLSVITGNAPTRVDGKGYILASGGQHNLMRYLEHWGSQFHHTLGSVVCMAPAQYSFGVMGGGDPGSMGWGFYNPPKRDFNMNTDLFTKPGQPPFTPFGIKVVRTVSMVQGY